MQILKRCPGGKQVAAGSLTQLCVAFTSVFLFGNKHKNKKFGIKSERRKKFGV